MITTAEKRHILKETCTRCCGSGNTGHRRWQGVCFRCGGNGFIATEVVFSVVQVEHIPYQKEISAMAEASWLMELFNS